ncbi:hypothetical protein NX801_24080 [Streptomyces sp. LP05-1]|uniref:Uncharacterized protein n=1 Tax=Streptomyces pyxinae TaxID=2970734 RepID=A0ABT2CMN1_9ACTN|nr:hypothetical protein [Streptomyces sp. LP05-1]MCS0638677.1 hypothetical protein [Streptomyces sp. LP05-1]
MEAPNAGTGSVPADPEEEALVERIRAQQAVLARLAGAPQGPAPAGPVAVEYGGETFQVPLAVRDVRAALPAEARDGFDQELAAAAPAQAGPVVRKWILEHLLVGDELDRVDVLLAAKERPGGQSAGVAADAQSG